MRIFVLMQKCLAFNELNTKGHNIVRTVMELQNSSRGNLQGNTMIVLPMLRADDVKLWYGMVGWRLDTAAKVLQQLSFVGISNCFEDDGNTTS